MGRVNWPRFALIACVGMFITVVVLPSTSWVTKNLIDAMRFGVDHTEGIDYSVPKNLLDGDLVIADSSTVAARGDEVQFVRALMQRQSDDVRAQLTKYTNAHPNDAMGWATLLRYTMMYGHLGREKDGTWDPKVFTVYQMGLRAAQQGAQADPGNAYFTLFEADIRHESGDDKGALALLQNATKATSYRDYVHQSIALETATIERYWGYRGEELRFQLAASALLPHLSHLREFGKWVAAMPMDHAGLTARRDIFRAIDVWSRGSETYIDIVVQDAICSTILMNGDKPFTGATVQERQAFYRARIPALEAQMERAGVSIRPGECVLVYDRLTQYMIDGGIYLEKAGDLDSKVRTDRAGVTAQLGFQAAAGCGLIILVVALCASLARSMNPSAPNLCSPFVLGGIAVAWCGVSFELPRVNPLGGVQTWVLALTMIAGIALSFTKVGLTHARLTKIIVLAVFALAVAFFPMPYLAALGVLMTSWMIAGSRPGFAILFASATMLFACLGIQQYLETDLLVRAMAVQFAAGVVALSVAALGPYGRKSNSILSIAIGGFSLFYLGFVANEVRTNEMVRPTFEAFMHEMEIIRGTRNAPSA